MKPPSRSLVTRWVIVTSSPVTLSSVTAVTITVCAVFQLFDVNVSDVGATVTPAPAVTPTTTCPDGSVVNSIVYDPDSPSATVNTVGATATPVSSSVTVTITVPTSLSMKRPSRSLVTRWVIVTGSSVTSSSSTPVTLTVCAVFQVSEVNVSDIGATVTPAPAVTPTTTSSDGAASSTTV